MGVTKPHQNIVSSTGAGNILLKILNQRKDHFTRMDHSCNTYTRNDNVHHYFAQRRKCMDTYQKGKDKNVRTKYKMNIF